MPVPPASQVDAKRVNRGIVVDIIDDIESGYGIPQENADIFNVPMYLLSSGVNTDIWI